MMNKKLRKFISMLSAATMLLSATMTSTGLAEETTETETQAEKATITLAYDSVADYKNENGEYPENVLLKNFPKEGESNVNGGYGWANAWNNGDNPIADGAVFVTNFGKSIPGYNTYLYRDLANSISLSKDGVYIFDYNTYVNAEIWNDVFTGTILYDSEGNEIGKIGLLGTETYFKNAEGEYTDANGNLVENRVLDQYYLSPYIKIGDSFVKGDDKLEKGKYYNISAKVTVDADGTDKIELNAAYSTSESGNYTDSKATLEGELGNDSITKICHSNGQATYFKGIRISKEIEGTKEFYGENTIAEDNFLVSEYGYVNANTESAFVPSKNLGTGWNGSWTQSDGNNTWKYYDGWRSDVLCAQYLNVFMSRKLENTIDFSKDAKYVVSFKDKFGTGGGGAGVKLRSGDTNILETYFESNGTNIKLVAGAKSSDISTTTFSGQQLYQNKLEINVNSNGNDTIKLKKYLASGSEPDSYVAEIKDYDLSGKTVDNVKFWYYQGGISGISIESNAVTAIRETTENGEKIYIDYVTPLKDKPVLKGADVSVVADSNGLVHSAIVEYDKTNSAIYANKENAIAIGDTKIPVSLFDEEAYPINALSQTAVAISEDFMDYDMSTAVSELNGGKGWSGAWQNTSAWALSSNQKSLWASWQQSINRDLANTLDFSQKGEYDIELVYAMQRLQPKVAYLQFKDENGSELLRLGVKMGIKADGTEIVNGETGVLTNTKAYIKIGSQETVSSETLYQRTGNYDAGDNSLYKLIAKIIVNGNGQDIIKVKAYKLDESVPTDWSYVSENVDLSSVKASNIGFYNGNIGGIASLEIKKPVASYRKAGDNVYMFFNNECVEDNSVVIAVGVNENGNMLTDVKRYDKWEDFSFSFSDSDAKARIFIWDGNMKPYTDLIEIAK